MHKSEILPYVEPLDLLLFRGKDFVSDFILISQDFKFTNSEFSHAGIVITKDILPIEQLDDNVLYVFESTYSGVGDAMDMITKKPRFGVQIRKLGDVIDTYLISDKTKMAVCKLNNNPYPKDKYKVRRIIQQIYQKHIGKLYELSPFQLFGTLFKCCGYIDSLYVKVIDQYNVITNIDDEGKYKWLFCSELVALTYLELGILKGIEPSAMTPMSFLHLTDSYSDLFSKPIYIIKDIE